MRVLIITILLLFAVFLLFNFILNSDLSIIGLNDLSNKLALFVKILTYVLMITLVLGGVMVFLNGAKQ